MTVPANKPGQRWVGVNERGRRVGSSHPSARLTDAQVDEIRSRHEDKGENASAIARAMGVSRRTVRGILSYARRAQTVAEWKKITD